MYKVLQRFCPQQLRSLPSPTLEYVATGFWSVRKTFRKSCALSGFGGLTKAKKGGVWIIKPHKIASEIEKYLPSFFLSLLEGRRMLTLQFLFSIREYGRPIPGWPAEQQS